MSTDHPMASDCRVCAAIRQCKAGGFAVGLFSLFQNLLILAVPLYMLQVYDRVLASHSMETLISLTVITALALVVLAVLDFARGRLLGRIGLWLDERLAPGLFERAVQSRLKGSNYGPEALGDLASLRNFVTSPGLTALFDLPWTAVFVGVAWLLHPYFGIVAAGAVLLLFALAAAGEWLTRTRVNLANEAAMLSRRQLDSTARNAEVIEAMGIMDALAADWVSRNRQALALQSEIVNRSTALASITRFVRPFVQTLTLGLGAWLVLSMEATGGTMIAASIVLTRALSPVEQAIGSWKSFIGVRGSIKRLKAFAMQPPYRQSGMALPAPKGALSVEGLVYRPPNSSGPPVLKGISFQLSPGESLGIIGPSGAGKSTLARLLIGAIPPTAGLVRLDGVDLFGWDRRDVGRHLGYLPQDIELFAGSASQNIARMGEIEAKRVVAAAQLADVHELILRLPHGYETNLGDGGEHLSGGQRQRIALARALYGRPAFVVLDEPNSNLDGDGEAALSRALTVLKKSGSTVVVVTHRIPLVQQLDKVLLLRDGLVEAFGPRQEVLTRLMSRQAAVSAEAGQRVVQLQKGA